ncbi:MAG: hypothetical protein FWE47_02465 [Oscillospiraceae bacterium]|nr:hypothetical protein [Oscillospiraceae bacterium]
MQKYNDLVELIRNEDEAHRYYYRLPSYVRDHIETRASNVNSFESLKDYAENLLAGDK